MKQQAEEVIGVPSAKEFLETLLNVSEIFKMKEYFENLLTKDRIEKSDIETLKSFLLGTHLAHKLSRYPNFECADIIVAILSAYLPALTNTLLDIFDLEDKMRMINRDEEEFDKIEACKKEIIKSILTLLSVVINWNGIFVGIGGYFLSQAFTQTQVSIQKMEHVTEEEKKKGWFKWF